jgi:uncharacterized protein (TIGR02246 family)
VLLPVLLATSLLQAEPVTALAPQPVIQAQLEAYNRHDAAGFAATYAEDAEVIELASGAVVAKGRAAIQTFYGGRFQANPKLHGEVIHRLLQGAFVIDQERITGIVAPDRTERTPLTAVVIYEMKDGHIARAWIAR